MPDSKPIRIRSHDKMVSTGEEVKRRRQCRKTLKIDNCVFRCDQFHTTEGLTIHAESGILKGLKNSSDTHYHITWEEHPSVTVRWARDSDIVFTATMDT